MIEKSEAQIEPAMVECEVCRRLIPPSQAVHPEGLDYVLYFCGAGYLAEWQKAREAGMEKVFDMRAGVEHD
jgi:hypothetical protein